jgi:hypothetical protein
VQGKEIYGKSVLSVQFYYKPKSSLKIESIKKILNPINKNIIRDIVY